MTRDMEIATQIKNQLGYQFAVMTGAKSFSTTTNGLCFKLPRGKHMTITVNGKDLYDIKLFRTGHFRMRRNGVGESSWVDSVELSSRGDVFVENLHETFTEMTGLYTHL
jgi:hypothetical protein